ncbi:hypothetical protein RFI_29250 [Reticulomyxa filosa]|uniref:Uncharacterized protein n=1 Tax=Reticulomyxa filosa TaxID=46433 RepID=X6M2L4_RETFI|nr:hypothetical protein RFI_29250 [Reticulomyxa filosa]|eukprot:ETO08139.1 hypothetical protein RFI_29250 [Reticulomyxa filosa]
MIALQMLLNQLFLKYNVFHSQYIQSVIMLFSPQRLATKAVTAKTSENVLCWEWLDGRTIAFVTDDTTYHWSVESDTTPEKKVETCHVQIINYDPSKNSNWLFLQGIAKNAKTQKMESVLQLYNTQHKHYQSKKNAYGEYFVEVILSGHPPCSASLDLMELSFLFEMWGEIKKKDSEKEGFGSGCKILCFFFFF